MAAIDRRRRGRRPWADRPPSPAPRPQPAVGGDTPNQPLPPSAPSPPLFKINAFRLRFGAIRECAKTLEQRKLIQLACEERVLIVG